MIYPITINPTLTQVMFTNLAIPKRKASPYDDSWKKKTSACQAAYPNSNLTENYCGNLKLWGLMMPRLSDIMVNIWLMTHELIYGY